jgi:hypothetical protein
MSRPRPTTTQTATALIVIALLAVVGPQFFRNPRVNQPTVTPPPSPAQAPDVALPPSSPTVTRPDIGFRSRATLEEHFQKHGREFGQGATIDAYLRAAQALRDAPAGGDILEHKRADGVTTRFDRRTGAFLAVNPDATLRTFFRPNDGEPYFHRQAQRPED